MFYGHSLAAQFLPVQVVHSILGITGVIELDKAVRVLQQDLPNAPIAFEEPLDVPFTHSVGQTTDVNSRPHDRRKWL